MIVAAFGDFRVLILQGYFLFVASSGWNLAGTNLFVSPLLFKPSAGSTCGKSRRPADKPGPRRPESPSGRNGWQ
jgi:hypothetical protein